MSEQLQESKTPTFTIIVPTYNQAQYLGACLDSVLSQTDADWEAIVVNDGSTDNTRQVADSYAKRDSRFRVFHKANGGVASALNKGLEQARGKWVQWLSSDDLFDPRKLEINRRAIATHPDCKFFYSYFRLLRESTGELTDHGLWGPLPDREVQIPTLFYRNYVSGITICVDREAWREVGVFDPSLRYGQDYDMWLRLLGSYPGQFIPEWTVTNRNHTAQGSETFPQACYYDTAKGGIRCLARGPLETLFPLLDLRKARHARRAVEVMLELSAADDAFIYALGWHPSVLLRVVEFVLSTAKRNKKLGRRLSTLVRWRCRRAIRRLGSTPAAFPWKIASAGLSVPGLELGDIVIDPEELGVARYFQLLAVHHPDSVPMRDYLALFHGRELPRARQGLTLPGEAAIEFHGVKGDFEAALRDGDLAPARDALLRRGWCVALMAEGRPRLTLLGGVPVFTAPAPVLARLRKKFEFEAVLSNDIARCGAAPGRLVMPLPQLASVDDGVEGLLQLLRWRADQVRQVKPIDLLDKLSIVFVIQSAIGGGAERATMNLAAELATRGRKIRIVTLEDRPQRPPTKRGVEIISLQARARKAHERRLSELNAASHALPLDSSAPATALAPTPQTAAGRLWAKLTPETRAFLHHLPYVPKAKNAVRALVSKMRTLKERAVLAVLALKPRSRSAPLAASVSPPFDPDPPVGQIHAALYPRTQAAMLLADALTEFGPEARVIAVMEDASIVTWLASTLTGISFVAWLHTLESSYLPQLYATKERFDAETALFAAATGRADRVVFPTIACGTDLAEMFRFPTAHITSIWNPVNIDETRRLATEAEPLSIEPHSPLFVAVGRLSNEKNHALLLDAFALLLKRHPSVRCRIIGEGELRRMVEQRAADLGLGDRLELPGYLDNPFADMANARALVLTSRFESFALVLVEAMALGVTPISVDCPTGPREVLGGDVGLLVPNDQPEALADAMSLVIQDEALVRLRVAAGLKRAEIFRCANAAERWLKLLDDVARHA